MTDYRNVNHIKALEQLAQRVAETEARKRSAEAHLAAIQEELHKANEEVNSAYSAGRSAARALEQFAAERFLPIPDGDLEPLELGPGK